MIKNYIIFTICSLIFLILLLVSYFTKERKDTIKSKFYILAMISAIFLAVFEIMTLYSNVLFPNIEILPTIIWKVRNLFVLIYLYLLVVYYNSSIKTPQQNTVKDVILKNKSNLIVLIIMAVASIFYAGLAKFEGFETGEITFVNGISATISFGATLVAMTFALVTSIKNRKNNEKLFQCILLINILLYITLPSQIYLDNISFVPFMTMVIIYIIYYSIENPDIAFAEEITFLKQNIDKSNNTKTDLLFNLSYDLIAPMNAIVSLSDSLSSLETFNKEEVIEDLNSIKYAGNTLLDSINNILDLSEADSENQKVNNKEYSVYELLNRMKALTISRIGAKNIQFDLNIADNISSKLSGDITKVQKALLNILSNSAKYTEIGKIVMKVTCTNEREIQTLHFKISDTGNGIKDEEKPFIFSENKDSKKTGAGLALCKKYIEEMQGTIRFDSVYGAGTTFYIDIPQTIVGTRLISEDMLEDKQTESIELIDCSSYKVLIVDDDSLDIKVTTRLLEKYKFQVTSIMSTLECIDRIKREEDFDMILLDHKMPEMDGMETMKALRDLDGYKIPKLVALTANAVTGAKEMYLKAGFDDYISKPIDTNELDKIIKKHFNK